jgi:hypothetical protein
LRLQARPQLIAGRDWYKNGAEELLARQGRTGGWGRLEETCFAILFLRKVTFSAPTERKVGKVTEKEDPPKRPAPDASLPFLRDWLLAGPFPAKKKNEDTMLQTEHFSPSKVKPAPVGRAGKEKWFRYRSDADEIDFKRAGRLAEWSTYYAACYLHAAEAAEAVFWIGAEDGFRLFLNGKQVFDGHHHGYSGDDHYRIPLRLAAGRNLVMLKIENVHSQCRFKVRVDAPEDVLVDIRRKGR